MRHNVIVHLYCLIRDLYAEHGDPRVAHMPLVGNLWIVLAFVGLYLAFVLHYGPKWMEHRKPFELKTVMQVYNVVQVVANSIIFLYGLTYTYLRPGFSWTCQPVDHSDTSPRMMHVLYASYGYYMLKYLDLLDTVFIILRKKNSQVSFLHVYHHGGMVFGVSIYMTFLGGSHCTMLGIINLLVHSVMYAYYYAASVCALQHILWWKQRITQLQLLQFGYLTLHFLLVIVRNPCHFPSFIAFIGFIQNIFMFSMFLDFYYKSYIRKERKVQQQRENSKLKTAESGLKLS
ncbi:elongation of very long chain fatty acids protein F [Drosophila subobscura]|uniref:elongation of very long chain fatty acids protein F n=1 Tax=Drosophila subobscura TaxID=7241 RepID=UPI00155ABA4A|nr:elongation of very long chain fatty acids protein F [Drosophila subobscura]XP_034659821.1 elongation of very long chain fatty acids protein F [Drosophila subobscura]